MATLTDDQGKTMLMLDDANVDPALINMDVVRELMRLGLIGKSGKDHLELTVEGEKAIKKLKKSKA